MIRSLTLCCLLFSCATAAADDRAEAVALLARAMEVTQLDGPIKLHAEISAPGAAIGKLNGTLTLQQASRQQWRLDIELADRRYTRLLTANRLYDSFTQGHVPLQVMRARDLLRFHKLLRMGPEAKFKKLRQRKHKGVELRCVVWEEYGKEHEACVNPASGAPAWIDERVELLEYGDAGGKQFPRLLRWREKNNVTRDVQTIEVRVVQVDTDTPDPQVFIPPANARVNPGCAVDLPYSDDAKTKVRPRYPSGALQGRMQGASTVYALVNTDGTLTNLTVVRSAGNSLDSATMEAVRQWRYEPPLCDGQPARVDVLITVNYELRPY